MLTNFKAAKLGAKQEQAAFYIQRRKKSRCGNPQKETGCQVSFINPTAGYC
jgi:hypothetical protein